MDAPTKNLHGITMDSKEGVPFLKNETYYFFRSLLYSLTTLFPKASSLIFGITQVKSSPFDFLSLRNVF